VTDSGFLGGYRDPALARALAREIDAVRLPRPLTFMHVCGTHEHAIAGSGLRALLRDGIRLVAGPGCPVCVCPAADIDRAIEAARRPNVTIATFGDMFRVPASTSSFEAASAEGADIRVVYSPVDAVRLAREHPGREVVFMAVGFETTAAPIAASLAADPPPNLSIIPSMRLIPPALRFLIERGSGKIDGFILPGHVSVVIGRSGYEFLEREHGLPAVIAGFEPLDVLRAVAELVRQVAAGGRGSVVNQYGRVVHESGNARAREAIGRLFAEADVPWRGIGTIPGSGLVLRPRHERLDASVRLALPEPREPVDVRAGCRCHVVILGEEEPESCPLFGVECTPRRPYGPCMVSSEGTCRARFMYRGPRGAAGRARGDSA
jgi:hydrogenase expression/formation protein HypD